MPGAEARLRIGIEKRDPTPLFGPADREMGSQCRLAGTALVLCHGDDLRRHVAFPLARRLRPSPGNAPPPEGHQAHRGLEPERRARFWEPRRSRTCLLTDR